MAVAATRGGTRALRRRIIERPRLLALLDESTARVRTLVAPAGYGKTTLAEQWVEKEGRRGAWFTARPSSTDVAALALGVARSACEIVPECDVRLREHLRALQAPADNVEVLAELLGEDLQDWPDNAWLVFDDYQEIAATADAEQFVEGLFTASPIQILIASRQRPSWITARKILYGDYLELNQTELAMDPQEAGELLSDRHAASASGLVALAHGWPAVIGLASVSNAEINDDQSVPESLYEFFADEVFSALGNDVSEGLRMLALAPVIDRTLAGLLLGDRAERVCLAALDVGILAERGAQFHIHPLARAFVESRREQLGEKPDLESVERCLTHFRDRQDWDAAFDVVARHGDASQLERLLAAALDELLETARLSTIENWCAQAERMGSEAPIFALGRSEVALRSGRLAAAQAYAQSSTFESSEFEFRALAVAGRAAHLASREEEALELFRRAETLAEGDALSREARFGQLMCLVDLERPEALAGLNELMSSMRLAPRDIVRGEGLRLYYHLRFGGIDVREADNAAQLIGTVGDPILESSFLGVYSYCLALLARYEDAEAAASQLLDIVDRYRLEFALPYALCSAGVAQAGLRQWSDAEETLARGVAHARATSHAHAEQHCLAAYARVLLQQGRYEVAEALMHEHSGRASAVVPLQMRIELMATRALIFAVMGRLEEALGVIEGSRGLSSAIEATVLPVAVDAIVGLKRHDANAIDHVRMLSETAFSMGGVDLLVTAYRSTPELLTVLIRLPAPESQRFTELVLRIGDQDLAAAMGHRLPSGDRISSLTAREREVHDLLRQGLTNREIAKVLVISEATAKLHVQHVFDKLGVRSRKAIAMQAALQRGSQATSAIDEMGVDSGS